MNNIDYKFRNITPADYEYIYRLKEDAYKEIRLLYFNQNPVGALYRRLGFEPAGESASHFKMVRRAQK